jgi:hypothetical protein
VEPGINDNVIDRLRQANLSLGNISRPRSEPDLVPPRVVLAWPIPCTFIKPGGQIQAVASDDSGISPRVEFLLDNQAIGSLSKPPYVVSIPMTVMSKKQARHLAAVAVDSTGNTARSEAIISTTDTSGIGDCPP